MTRLRRVGEKTLAVVLRRPWVPPVVAVVLVVVASQFGFAWLLATTVTVSLVVLVLAVRLVVVARRVAGGRERGDVTPERRR